MPKQISLFDPKRMSAEWNRNARPLRGASRAAAPPAPKPPVKPPEPDLARAPKRPVKTRVLDAPAKAAPLAALLRKGIRITNENVYYTGSNSIVFSIYEAHNGKRMNFKADYLKRLVEQLPQLALQLTCPVVPCHQSEGANAYAMYVILWHLEHVHGWTREEAADWLGGK